VMKNLDPQNPKAIERDRFVLSKGHCVEALYVTLEAKGFLAPEVLDTLGQFGSILSGHPTIEVPGIEVNSGALGHGLSIGVGMAIAAKMDKKQWKTYVLMGDGEQGEGSIYEAAMAANKYQLDNLVAIIDRNHLQISGNTEDVMPIDSIKERWTAFGWDVVSMNGDEMEDIIKTFDAIDYQNGKPHLIISETTKGKGVSFMEGIAKWHHGVLNEEQCKAAVKEIKKRIDIHKDYVFFNHRENVSRFVNLSVWSLTPSKNFHKEDASGQVSNIVVATFKIGGDEDISFVNDGGLFHGNLRIPDRYFTLEDGTDVSPEAAFETWKQNAIPKLTVGNENYIGVYGFNIPILELTNGKSIAVHNKLTGNELKAFRIATICDSVDDAIYIANANLRRATTGVNATHVLVPNPEIL